MSLRRALIVVGMVVVAAAAGWWLTRPPAVSTAPAPIAQPHQPAASPLAPPVPPPEPAPHPPTALPPPEDVPLAMADGNPLRAHFYPSAVGRAPVIVLDLGAGAVLPPWRAPLQALLAQRPAHVLWLDDVQPRHPQLVVRQARALARWRAALAWLDQRAPDVRLALVGAQDAADAIWQVAGTPRPLSIAVLLPDAPPSELSPAVAQRFALIGLPDAPTPTWLGQLHNARTLALRGEMTPQLAADLAGWLFVALGPR